MMDSNRFASSGSSAKEALREKLTTMIQQMEEGNYDAVRAACFTEQWLEEMDVAALPENLLTEMKAVSDAVQSSLMRWPPDLYNAEQRLIAARELLDLENGRYA